MESPYTETDRVREARARVTRARAETLVQDLGSFCNAMSGDQIDAFATALAAEHPTIVGQIAKAVGMGVMRRATREPGWKPYDPMAATTPRCGIEGATDHAVHDGRLNCSTVRGAELMARQSFI